MTPLEDELRGSLARQAGHPSAATPDPDQLADRVIRKARRVRRRRRLGGASTAVALAAAAGLGLVYLPEREQPSPVAAPSATPSRTQAARLPSPAATAGTSGRTHVQAREVVQLPVDVLADHRLVTTEGKTIDVSFAGAVSQVYRIDAGWLFVGVPEPGGPASLWLLSSNGRHRALLSDVDAVAVGASGQRVAWRDGSRLWAGVLTPAGVSQREHTLAVGSGVPIGFVGDGVLLARGGAGGYKMWWPGRPVYQPGWSDTAVRVYGSLSDGQTVVAQVALRSELQADKSAVAAPQRCLALLDATRALLPRTTACGLDLGVRSPGAVSPDGRWLVTGSGGRTVLVDLTAPLDSQPRVIRATPPLQGGVAWLDEHTVVLAVGTGRVVVQLRLDAQNGRHSDDTKRWPVPVVAGKPVLVVPRLDGGADEAAG